jgi:hypothetical protein
MLKLSLCIIFKDQVRVMSRPTVSRAICPDVKPHLGHKTRFLLLQERCRFADVVRPLWQEDGYIIWNCCLSLPTRSLSAVSTTGLMTIFCFHRFESQTTWRVRSHIYVPPPGTRWPIYTLRHWVPLSSPPTTRSAKVEVFEPTSTRGTLLKTEWYIQIQSVPHSNHTSLLQRPTG